MTQVVLDCTFRDGGYYNSWNFSADIVNVYLSGKYGIHPTYIQEMLGDARYDEEDILAVIDYLRTQGGKKFSFDMLNGARQFYRGKPTGTCHPASVMKDREVLTLGTGLCVKAAARRRHASATPSAIR